MPAYRELDSEGLEATTADGVLRVELGARGVEVSVGARRLQITRRSATLIADRTATEFAAGEMFVARGQPCESLGIWIAHSSGVVRVFGVEPLALLRADGLGALARLDIATRRLRIAVADVRGRAPDRSLEIGAGHVLDRVLVADRGDHYAIYARSLFRTFAKLVAKVYPDGLVTLAAGGEVALRSRYDVTVRGDFVRFADRTGADLARISVPWLAREDREQLARLIGQLASARV